MNPLTPRRARRLLARTAMVAAGVALAGTVATIAGAAQPTPTDQRQGGGAALLSDEIAAMRASGLRADDPKVRMLQGDLAALERGRDVTPPTEPGVDVGAVLGDPGARDATTDRSDTRAWDNGVVQCEEIPPDLLTAADIAGATCTSTVDSDGGSHYKAVGPGGTVHSVHFAADGTVTRVR
jgi:hypothetical protein